MNEQVGHCYVWWPHLPLRSCQLPATTSGLNALPRVIRQQLPAYRLGGPLGPTCVSHLLCWAVSSWVTYLLCQGRRDVGLAGSGPVGALQDIEPVEFALKGQLALALERGDEHKPIEEGLYQQMPVALPFLIDNKTLHPALDRLEYLRVLREERYSYGFDFAAFFQRHPAASLIAVILVGLGDLRQDGTARHVRCQAISRSPGPCALKPGMNKMQLNGGDVGEHQSLSSSNSPTNNLATTAAFALRIRPVSSVSLAKQRT